MVLNLLDFCVYLQGFVLRESLLTEHVVAHPNLPILFQVPSYKIVAGQMSWMLSVCCYLAFVSRTKMWCDGADS